MDKRIIPQYEPMFGQKEADAVYDYMKTGAWLTEHTKTKEFETQVAKFLGVEHCIAVNNGTISLSLALLALGIKANDSVIVPSLSMIATANAVRLIGAKPIFCDVEKETLCLDTENTIDLIEKYSQYYPNLKAVIYVSLNGRRGCTCKLRNYCKKHNIGFIEDAAQAFGSSHKCCGMIGNMAEITSFSLSPHKIISTGQGGLLTTNDRELAQKLRRLKDFGRDRGGADIHDHFGINSKFTDMQAVVGIEQLSQIKQRMDRKREIYAIYNNQLKNIPEIEFIHTDLDYVVPWFCDLYTKYREELSNYLTKQKIGTRKLYPPIHKQKCYNMIDSLPITEEYSSKGLWLPSSFALSNQEIVMICKKIQTFFNFE